jgi:hypothetical protein
VTFGRNHTNNVNGHVAVQDYIIQAEGAVKTYHTCTDTITALNGIDFTVRLHAGLVLQTN